MLKKIKSYCADLGFGCTGCCLKNNGECVVKRIPDDWQIPTLKPQLTDDEKVILRNLGKKYKWLATSCDGDIWCFVCDVERSGSYWTSNDEGFKGGHFGIMLVSPNLFKWCKWEDEPYLIEDLLKE